MLENDKSYGKKPTYSKGPHEYVWGVEVDSLNRTRSAVSLGKRDLSKHLKQRSRGVTRTCGRAGTENSKCKGPEAEMLLGCWKNSEIGAAGTELRERKEVEMRL